MPQEPNEPNGGSNQTPNPDQDGKQPGVDPQELANLVNSAVSAQLKRALPKAIEGIVPSLIEGVTKQLGDKQPPKDPEPTDKPKPSPELVALQRSHEELKTQLQREREAREAAERRQRDDRAFADLRAQLSAGGVRAELVDTWAKVLFHADKRVEFDESGAPLLKVKVSPGKGMPEEEQLFPLSDGVKQLLKTKEAEPYLPPPGGAQSGTQGRPQTGQRTMPRYDKPATSEEEKARRVEERMAALDAKF